MSANQYIKPTKDDAKLYRSITLPNDIEAVTELSAFVDEVCDGIGLDMSTAMSVNLAVEEAVVNVMTYGYAPGTSGDVQIEAAVDEHCLYFTLSDSGMPFDPTTAKEADTTLPAEQRPIGGLGIHLVRQIMDSIKYERIDGENVLTLCKLIN